MIKKPLKPALGLVSGEIVKVAEELTLPQTQKQEESLPLQAGKPFNIPRNMYQSYLLNHQAGQIRHIQVNSCKVTLLSQYSAGLNLYKMLNLSRPSCVLLQVRPDDIFSKNFRLSQSLPEFLTNIRRSSIDLMPSSTHYYNTTLALKRRRIMTAFSSATKPEKIRLAPYTLVDRVHDYTVAYAARWGLHRQYEKFYVGDLPREAFIREITGSMTLIQLQNIFTSTCQMIIENPDIVLKHEPRSPLTAAYKLYPDLFLAPSDRFLACILTNLATKYKTIFCVLGNGQCESLPLFAENTENGLTYEEMMQPEWKYKGFLSSETEETAVEKRALLDVMTFGLDLVSSIATHKAMKRTESFISEVISDLNRASSFTLSAKDRQDRTRMLTLLYLSSLQKYKSVGLHSFQAGRDRLKAEFMVALT